MKRLTASILALGLAASVGTASAQSGYYPPSDGYGQYGQPNGQPSVDRYGQSSGVQYDYARVVRVDPVLDSGYGSSSYRGNSAQNCYTRRDGYVGSDPYYGNGARSDGQYVGDGDYRNDGYQDYGRNSGYGSSGYGNGGTETGRTIATVIGGVLGAAIGSQVGGGSARYATAAVGSMVGGMAGRQVYETNQRNRYPRSGAVTVCDPVPANGNGDYYPTNDRGVSAYDVTYEYASRRYVTRTDYHPGDRIRVRVDVRPE
jgi:uncharacterized protein YcfJ